MRPRPPLPPSVERDPLLEVSPVPRFQPRLWVKLLALTLGFGSYLTTVWFVEWVWVEGGVLEIYLVAGVLELLFIGLKLFIFDGRRHSDVLGWVAILVDSLINAAGIMPRADRILSFPPITVILGLLGLGGRPPMVVTTVRLGDDTVFVTLGGFILSLTLGVILSWLPVRLWRS